MLQDEFGETEVEELSPDALGQNLETAVRRGMGATCTEEDVAIILEGNIHWRCPAANEELDEILASDILEDVISKEAQKDVDASQKTRKAQAQEAAIITRTVARIRKNLASKKKKSSASASSSSSALSSSSSSVAAARKAVSFESNARWSQEDVQAKLPPFYRAFKDSFNGRFRVYHKSHQWSCSRSWGPTGNDSKCVQQLLLLVWRRYLELNPEQVCPFKFE